MDKDITKKSKYKNSTAITTNNSTLSLHITAYENSVEQVASNNKTKEFSLTKTWKIAKPNCIEKLYEFPRQQKEVENTDPEVMQFKASQRLVNPNATNSSNKQYFPSSGMFPQGNRSSGSDASRNYNGRNDRNSWNNQRSNRQENYDRRNNSRQNNYNHRGRGTYDQRRRTFPNQSSRGYGFERETLEQKQERQRTYSAIEEADTYKKKYEDLQREVELDKEAQRQRFGAFDDSSSSDGGGGAPIMVKRKKDKKEKKNKRRRGSSSDSSSSSSRSRKQRKYSDDETEKYEFLLNLTTTQPKLYTHTAPEKRETSKPDYDIRHKRSRRKRKTKLDDTVLKTEFIEHLFPPKEPTEVEDSVCRIEEAPYDTVNSASVSVRKEIDWESIPFEEFLAMNIIDQNIFAQSSASKKVIVFKSRLQKATKVEEKIECYVNLVNLEEARMEESRKTGRLTGKVDTNAVKLSIIGEGLRECGQNVELRLLELDILTASKGENSEEVKNAWDTLMNKFPNDLKMWRRRLTYFRNKRSLFNSSSYIKHSLIPCLNKLGGIINNTFVTHKKQTGTEEFIVDVIVAAATLYIEMGATYKAIGILQALVEFYFLVPKVVKDNFDFKKKLAAFESYWRAEIPKAGNKNAVGWYKQSANASYSRYDYPKDNKLLTAEDETKAFNNFSGNIIRENMSFCEEDKILSTCERWSKIEQYRTERFWEPLYNSESKPTLLKQYNWYYDISPYLMQLPKEIVEKAVFKILTKLGAVFPDINDYSQEAIYKRCRNVLVDENFKIEYQGMNKFVDNILHLISGANEEMFVYATVARLMTIKSFILNAKNGNTSAEEANAKFRAEIKNVFSSLQAIRDTNEHEQFIMNSYVKQLMNEISNYYEQNSITPFATTGDKSKILTGMKNIFDDRIEIPQLLAAIRFYVMMCRDLPYYADDDAEKDLVTKLKFLMKVSFPTEDIDYEKKENQEKAIQKWKNVRFHENCFDLPSGARWIGDINAFAVELLSTLCYEVEEDPTMKFEAFAKYYSQDILERHEDLAEIYFKTWNRHLIYYYGEKKEFLVRLKAFIDIFPRNDILTSLYIETLKFNEIETRNFFLPGQRDDDIVKVLRCVLQLYTEFENIRYQKSLNSQKSNNRYFIGILKNSAELSLTNIIPESHLWRSALYFVKYAKNTDFKNTFLVANDQCPWSKILLTHAASLSSGDEFVENIEALAKKADIKLMTSLSELKQF